MKNRIILLLLIFNFFLHSQSLKENLITTFYGDANAYAISESNSFFGNNRKSWLETSAHIGLIFNYKSAGLTFSGLALKTTGKDKFGSGSIWLLDSSSLSNSVLFELDNLYFTASNIFSSGVNLFAGRQNITFGTQFLIGDGVYDGFHKDALQAIYHNPRKWFDAIRLQLIYNSFTFDWFIYSVHPTWDGGGERNGWLSGLHCSYTDEETKNIFAGGLFYRNSNTYKDNDMALLNLRTEYNPQKIKGLTISREFVYEFAGKGYNLYYITTAGQIISDLAFHTECIYNFVEHSLLPFIEIGYVYYSKDFTPVATGFSDWGKWYLGNQIDWMVFSTDSKIIRAQFGFYPTELSKFRLQYHNTNLVSNKIHLSDEFSFIAEWYPKDWLWFNMNISYSIASKDFLTSGLVNSFSYLYSDAEVVSNNSSLDFVLCFGVKW